MRITFTWSHNECWSLIVVIAAKLYSRFKLKFGGLRLLQVLQVYSQSRNGACPSAGLQRSIFDGGWVTQPAKIEVCYSQFSNFGPNEVELGASSTNIG